MKTIFAWLFDGLNEARGEIIATTVLACLAGLWKFFPKVWKRIKQYFQHSRETQQEAPSQNVDDSNCRNESEQQLEALQQEQKQIYTGKQCTAISDNEFIKLCAEGNAEKIEEAINNGANIEAKDDNGNTALILAASEGYTQIVELLLQYGANINAKDNKGYTAFSVARSGQIRRLLHAYHGAKE